MMGMRRVFVVRQAPRTGRLAVSVVDDQGQAVAGAFVSVYPPGVGRETDAEGRAVFEGLPPGLLDVGARRAGHGARRGGAPGRVARQAALDAGQQQALTLKLVRLSPGPAEPVATAAAQAAPGLTASGRAVPPVR